MRARRPTHTLAVFGSALALLLAGCAQPPVAVVPPKPAPTAAEIAARQAAEAAAIEQAALDARVAQARQLADEAYVYGYPLVLSEMFRQQMSGVAKPAGIRVPANSFWHARRLPPQAEPHPLVDQADTLTSFAWLDLGREAMLIAHPSMGRRFFSLALYSQWMQALEVSGSGLSDTKAMRVLVVGPEWKGTAPAGARLLRSPTRHVLVAVRIQTDGSAADLRAVRALQQRMRIVPQTVRGSGARSVAGTGEPAIEMVAGETPWQRVARLDTAAYFDLLTQLLASSAPPAAADAPLLDRMATLGIEPGKTFHLDALEPAVQAGLKDTGARARQQLRAQRPRLFAGVGGGWQVLLPAGDFGTDYLHRAAVAAETWPGPLPPQQLLQMRAHDDAQGQRLNGAHDYRLVFEKGQLPPVDGFWSLTLQAQDTELADRSDGHGFVANSVDRIGLGTRDKLEPDADGALKLFVQTLKPGYDLADYWLPASKGDFMLTLRLYAPRRAPPSALPPGAGSWPPPRLVSFP